MKEEIKKIISKAIKNLGSNVPEFSVEVSADEKFGDYSTNAALVLAKQINKNPRETAELIKSKISERNGKFTKIEIAGPGFINFFVSGKIFIEAVKNIDKDFGKNSDLKNKKIILDHTDLNPFKQIHVGHLMTNAIGESLSRIFKFSSANVKSVCYQGDVGMHVAKAVWGMKNLPDHPMLPRDDDPSHAKMKFLSMAYAFGAKMYEEEKERKEIIDLNKKIFEKSDKEINALYNKGKKWSLEHFGQIYKILGTKFDWLIFESETGPLGKKIVEKALKEKIFSAQGGPASGWEEGENGAIIFKGEKYGLHTRVFINSEGLPTYEAKDLGLAEIKYKKFPYDQSFIITGNEVNEYFKVMLCAMKEVLPKLAEKTRHIGHGMMRLPEGKISSRSGKAMTGESLIEKVKELIIEKIKDKEFSESERNEIAEKVAIGAIKYSILKQSIGSDIIYDFDKSISFEGDSGPYLQYSYTRAISVLKKAKEEGIKPSFKYLPDEAGQLEKIMSRFAESVSKANQSLDPHFVALYLTQLAGEFNSYYSKNRIVDKSDKLSPYKVALTKAFSIIMDNGLWLLGITTLDKM